jgi:hypothetical protein
VYRLLDDAPERATRKPDGRNSWVPDVQPDRDIFLVPIVIGNGKCIGSKGREVSG